MESTPGIGLGRPVQRMLQGTDQISRDTPAGSLRGGTSPTDTHRTPPDRHAHRRSSGPSHHRRLCCPAAQPVLRPPPTPTRPAIHFPGSPVIGRHAPVTLPQVTGPGRASLVPAATLDTFRAPYAGESLTTAHPGTSPLPWPSPRLRRATNTKNHRDLRHGVISVRPVHEKGSLTVMLFAGVRPPSGACRAR